MSRNVIVATLLALVVGVAVVAVGYFVLSSTGIVSAPAGGVIGTPQKAAPTPAR